MKSVDRVLEILAADTAEYITAHGAVTVEFSMAPALLDSVREALTAYSAKIKQSGLAARWIVYECETCCGYDEAQPLHVSVEKYQFCPWNGTPSYPHLHDTPE